jgi:hypothetical protein
LGDSAVTWRRIAYLQRSEAPAVLIFDIETPSDEVFGRENMQLEELNILIGNTECIITLKRALGDEGGHRLVGVQVSDKQTDALAAAQFRSHEPSVQRVRPTQYHRLKSRNQDRQGS